MYVNALCLLVKFRITKNLNVKISKRKKRVKSKSSVDLTVNLSLNCMYGIDTVHDV